MKKYLIITLLVSLSVTSLIGCKSKSERKAEKLEKKWEELGNRSIDDKDLDKDFVELLEETAEYEQEVEEERQAEYEKQQAILEQQPLIEWEQYELNTDAMSWDLRKIVENQNVLNWWTGEYTNTPQPMSPVIGYVGKCNIQADDKILTLGETTLKEVCDMFSDDVYLISTEQGEYSEPSLSDMCFDDTDIYIIKHGISYFHMNFGNLTNEPNIPLGDTILTRVYPVNGISCYRDANDSTKVYFEGTDIWGNPLSESQKEALYTNNYSAKNLWYMGGLNAAGEGLTYDSLINYLESVGYTEGLGNNSSTYHIYESSITFSFTTFQDVEDGYVVHHYGCKVKYEPDGSITSAEGANSYSPSNDVHRPYHEEDGHSGLWLEYQFE